ncbi:MAG TPA: hypothetical protein VM686_35600 [Polyangiaceae bacterium]|nr:hypothetical protein [Polyangiaceae bacterium]
MRIMNLVLVAALGASAFGCSKDGEVLDFVKENDSLVAEIKKSSDPDAARKAFDSKKDTLKSKLEPLKNARGFQVKEESMTALTKSLQDGVTTVCSLQISVMGDETKSTKYKTLCDDYTSVMSM